MAEQEEHVKQVDFKTKLTFCLGEKSAQALRLLPTEISHRVAICLLQHDVMNLLQTPDNPAALHQMDMSLPGVGELAHPIGLAAGFDRNCRVPLRSFAKMKFSFCELGSVTPFPQRGNDKPRIFRLPEQRGIISRFGSENDGCLEISRRLAAQSWNHDHMPIGVNLEKNTITSTERAIDDYFEGYRAFSELARYFVVNIHSGSTGSPAGSVGISAVELIERLSAIFSTEKSGVWLKLDPDMSKKEFQLIVEAAADRGLPGLILCNARKIVSPQVGRVSGHALAVASSRCLEWAWEVHRGQLAMVGSGGILCGSDIFEKIARGANAVQIYTALMYRGPWVVLQLLGELAAEMSLRGIHSLSDVHGSFYTE